MRVSPRPRPSTRRISSILLCALLCLMVGAVSAAPAAAAGRYHTRVEKLARGLQWRRVVDPLGPNVINALVVTPSRRLRLTLGAAGATMPSAKITSKLARRARAVAAVNGDFKTDQGRSLHPFVKGGSIVHTGVQIGSLLAVTKDRKTAYLGRPEIGITVADGSLHGPRKVAAWNGGQPQLKQMVAFTDAGGTV